MQNLLIVKLERIHPARDEPYSHSALMYQCNTICIVAIELVSVLLPCDFSGFDKNMKLIAIGADGTAAISLQQQTIFIFAKLMQIFFAHNTVLPGHPYF